MVIRPATLEDVNGLLTLGRRSVLGLSEGFYDAEQTVLAAEAITVPDLDLIADGSLFVALVDDVIVGCGGWSRRKKAYTGSAALSGEAAFLDPATEAAKIRAYFVDPAFARRGIARALFERCRLGAARFGFRRLELVATLPGVPLYEKLGFVRREAMELPLVDGTKLPAFRMDRDVFVVGRVSSENVKARPWGDGCLAWDLLGGDQLCVVQESMPPGTAELEHYHRLARQFFFVLSGELTITVGGVHYVLRAREGLEIAPGDPHLVRNMSDQTVEFLAIAHPSTVGDRYVVKLGPQLRMRAVVSDLPSSVLPLGYSLRVATAADAAGIAAVLVTGFSEPAPWVAERVRVDLLDHPQVPVTFVVVREDVVVGTASYQVKPEEFPESGFVHYVGVHPDHSGQGLGFAVSLAVLEECARRGHADAYLTTDDFRLPAIATYLKLGFVPDMWHDTHAERWGRIFETLAARR